MEENRFKCFGDLREWEALKELDQDRCHELNAIRGRRERRAEIWSWVIAAALVAICSIAIGFVWALYGIDDIYHVVLDIIITFMLLLGFLVLFALLKDLLEDHVDRKINALLHINVALAAAEAAIKAKGEEEEVKTEQAENEEQIAI